MMKDDEEKLLRSVALQNANSIRIARQRAEQRTEAALREQANLLNLTHDTIFVRGMDDVITYWNRGAEELYGWTAENAVGKVSHQIMQTIFPGPLAEINAELLRTGRWEGELKHTKRDGRQVVVASRWSLQRDERQRPLAILETNNDITERKQAEMLLAGEKRLLEMIAEGDSRALILDAVCRLFEQLADGSLSSVLLLDTSANRLRHGAAPSLPITYIKAIDGIVIGPSVGSCGTAAYRAEPVIVADIATDPLWAEYRDLALAHGLRACWSRPILSSAGRVLGTLAIYYREPRSPTTQDHNVIEQVTHLASIAVEREQAEAALREQANLLNLTHDTIFVRGVDDVITYWNRGAEELYGWTAENAVGKVSHQLTQTIFPAPLAEINTELLRTGRWEGELIHTKRDGTQVVVASRWSLQRDERQQPLAILETNNDVTERKRAEAELRESERRYRYIFRSTGVSIWEEDFSQVKIAIDDLKARGVQDFHQYLAAHPEFVDRAISMVKILDVNEATLHLFGAQHKHELLASLDKIFTPETRQVFSGELIALAQGKTSFESQTSLRTLKGDRISVVFTIAFPAEPANLSSVLVSILDISEQKRAEEALRQSQAELAHVSRVTTMGELTASLAHEVNQPLSAVVANGHACLRWLLADPPNVVKAHEAAERIVRDGKDAGEIVRRVRAVFKRTAGEKVALDLNEVIGEVLRLLRGDATRRRVLLETDLDKSLPSVMADRIQLQQVLLNLVLNGVEAMDSVVDRPRRLFIRSARESADAAVIEIRDHGIGVEHPEKVFQAFFTTKENGMGMGLAICRSIIDAHHGRLWFASSEGPGATVCFTIPFQSSGAP